jgi:hypothetical protein
MIFSFHIPRLAPGSARVPAALCAFALACAALGVRVQAAVPAWDAVPLTQRSQTPDIVLTGTVTDADAKTTRHVPFEVPEGVVRLGIELLYTGRDRGTFIDLGLFDPSGFRGWSGSNKRSLVVSATDATPSYLPGPIRAGRWVVDLGISAIRAHEQSAYTLKVFFWRHGDTPLASTFSPEPLRRGLAWYRGDFHLHDAHSDGFCTSQSGQHVPCPLYKTVAAAAARRLDFIAVTDHNATSQFNVLHELQPYYDELLLIPGREITTPAGHANVWGTTEFIDYRIGAPSARTMNDVLRDAAALNGVISVNHPSRITSEACRGCGWTAPNVNYHLTSAIEIVNSNDEFATNAQDKSGTGVSYWQHLLDTGLRLTAVGGSDTHDVDVGSLGVGVPTTVVHASELSERAVLEAVRAGHVFVDVEGSRNRLLTAEATSGAGGAEMGDALAAPNGSTIHISVHITGCQSAHVVVLQQGRPTTFAQATITSDEDTHSFDVRSDGERRWLRVEVRSADGVPVLIGNPFYVNYPADPGN